MKYSFLVVLNFGVALSALVESFAGVQGSNPTRTLIGNEIKDLDFTDTLHVLLGDDDTVSISYLLQGDDLIINLETVVGELGGWVGFGIGENRTGSMKGADIVTVSFNENGVPIAEDRHLGWVAFPMSPETAFPLKDKQQDWHVVEGAQVNGVLSVTIKRKIDTGDHEEDRVIDVKYENRIIVAKGPGQFIGYHQSARAGYGLDFSRPVPSRNILDVLENVDELIEIKMVNYSGFNSRVTTYAQKAFAFDFEEEMDIIAFEPLLTKENLAQLHHLVILDCLVPHQVIPDQTFDSEQELTAITGGACFTIVYAWAVGGGPFIFPKETGLRVGGNGLRSITLEFHYDNPRLINIVDNSGVRLYTTKTLRPNEAYVLSLGDPALSFTALKAGDSCITRRGKCSPGCTNKFSQPLTAFGSMLHMHARGRQAYTKLNGVIQNKIDFWDFAFQHIKPVSYTINPGDVLETVCNYDASTATRDIPFNEGSLDEMCFDFVYYYPKDAKANNCGFFRVDDEDSDVDSVCTLNPFNGDQDELGGIHLGYDEFMKKSAACLDAIVTPGDSATYNSFSVVALLLPVFLANVV